VSTPEATADISKLDELASMLLHITIDVDRGAVHEERQPFSFIQLCQELNNRNISFLVFSRGVQLVDLTQSPGDSWN
jgi:hypothetical protein